MEYKLSSKTAPSVDKLARRTTVRHLTFQIQCVHAQFETRHTKDVGAIYSPTVLSILALALSSCSQHQLMQTAERLTGGNVSIGQHLIYGYGCGSCHIIPGIAGARGTVGPALDGFASRVYIAGSLTNEPDHVVAWITDPQKIVPGNAMPSLGVTQEQARQMAAFLYTLR